MKAAIDKAAYKLLLKFKLSCSKADHKGTEDDLKFLHNDLWLQDTAVVERVVKLNGAWQVFLVFVHFKNPLLFIKRYIKTQISSSKATLEATYMRRLAAKDQRGTLEIDCQALNICQN